MDTHSINHYLKNEKNFIGTFARDQLPRILPKKFIALIVNTDPSTKPGEHWIAITFNKDGTGEYFDSYGLPPLNLEFIKFMQKHSPNGWVYNPVTLQCFDCITCGHYCIAYVKYRCHDYSFCDFLALFTSNTAHNDHIVRSLFEDE
jgi:hypothetical protein